MIKNPVQIFYICSKCYLHSGFMVYAKEQHEITEEEKKEFKFNPEFEYIGHEILICPVCNTRNTWFMMRKAWMRVGDK